MRDTSVATPPNGVMLLLRGSRLAKHEPRVGDTRRGTAMSSAGSGSGLSGGADGCGVCGIARVANAVVVRVGLIGVWNGSAIVAGVADAILVDVALEYIGDELAVVEEIGDPIAV